AKLTLVGYLPARYLPVNNGAQPYGLATVQIRGGVIKAITPLAPADASRLRWTQEEPLIHLRDGKGDYDVIYPGMVNLHNHTEYNIMPIWDMAKGQFENRFEWRAWGNYK